MEILASSSLAETVLTSAFLLSSVRPGNADADGLLIRYGLDSQIGSGDGAFNVFDDGNVHGAIRKVLASLNAYRRYMF